MRPLSHSAIKLYERCPQAWYQRYVERRPQEVKHFLSFGKSLHSALEYWYKVKTSNAPSLESLLKEYRRVWIPKGYATKKLQTEYKAEGEKILREYYDKHIDSFARPYFVEYAIHMKIEGVPFCGYVDRIDKVGDKINIIDYKTGKAFDQKRVDTDDQLTVYQMACEELLSLKVDKLVFYHLNSQTPMVSSRRKASEIKKVKNNIVRVAKNIRDEKFNPDPEEVKCGWCEYKAHCPAFQHQRAQTKKKVDRSEADLVKMIDEYGKAKSALKVRENKVIALKTEVEEAMEQLGYTQGFGKEFITSITKTDVWTFPKDNKADVIKAITDAGLVEAVSAPQARLITKLVQDPSTPKSLLKKIEALGQLDEATTLRIKKVK